MIYIMLKLIHVLVNNQVVRNGLSQKEIKEVMDLFDQAKKLNKGLIKDLSSDPTKYDPATLDGVLDVLRKVRNDWIVSSYTSKADATGYIMGLIEEMKGE